MSSKGAWIGNDRAQAREGNGRGASLSRIAFACVLGLLAVAGVSVASCGPPGTPPPSTGTLPQSTFAFSKIPGVRPTPGEFASVVMPPSVCGPQGRIFVSYGNGNNVERMSGGLGCFAIKNGANPPIFPKQCFTYQEVQTDLLFNAAGQLDIVVLDNDPNAYTAAQAASGTTCAAPPATCPLNCIWPLPAGSPCTCANAQRDNSNYTDSQIVRVNTGFTNDVMHVFLDLRYHAPANPVITATQSPMNPGAAPATCNNPFTTSALAIDKSKDCGATWTKVKVFDTNDPTDAFFTSGGYAVPEYSGAFSNSGAGFALDRPEVFVDTRSPLAPVTPVFISVSVRLGPLAGTHLLIRSFNGGDSWEAPIVIPPLLANQVFPPPGDQGAVDGEEIPAMMTATHASVPDSGVQVDRLYVLRCEVRPNPIPPSPEGALPPVRMPIVRWSDDYGLTWPEANQVNAAYHILDANGGDTLKVIPCGRAPSASLGGLNNGDSGHGLVWIDDSDAVLVAYPALDPTNGTYQITAMTNVVFRRNEPVILDALLVDESAQGRHVVHSNLVGSNRFDGFPSAPGDVWADGAVLFWYSVPQGGGPGTTMRYIAEHNGQFFSAPTALSVSNGSPYSFDLSGAPPFGVGDYTRGSFFFSKSLVDNSGVAKAQFFVPWGESKTVPPGTCPGPNGTLGSCNVQIRGNIVGLTE